MLNRLEDIGRPEPIAAGRHDAGAARPGLQLHVAVRRRVGISPRRRHDATFPCLTATTRDAVRFSSVLRRRGAELQSAGSHRQDPAALMHATSYRLTSYRYFLGALNPRSTASFGSVDTG